MSLRHTPRFEILEHTADLGLRVNGADAAEVFRTATSALFSLILECRPRDIVEVRRLTLEAAGYPELLCDFLNHLLYLFDAEKLVPVNLQVDRLDASGLDTRVSFGRFEPADLGVRTCVKAVTYHQLRFYFGPTGATAEFFLDV